MDILDTIYTYPGLDIARATYHRAHSSVDRKRPREIATGLAKQLPITTSTASRLVLVGQSWFGALRSDWLGWEKTPEKQLRDTAIAQAEEAHLSWEKLDVITTCVNQVHAGAVMSPEQVRVQLVEWACEDGCTCDRLKEKGTNLVRQINQPASRKNRYLAFSTNPDATGCKTMMLKAEEKIINQAMADVVITHMLRTGAATGNAARTAAEETRPGVLSGLGTSADPGQQARPMPGPVSGSQRISRR